MSLVGSLEDLGLGDILQIISLSRKSGVLLLRSEHGEGQILFHQGLIRGAFVKGGPTVLRELLDREASLPTQALETAARDAHARGVALADLVVERGLLTEARVDELRRANIEDAVLAMFGWPTGEFSFEVREVDGNASEELFVAPGINPQFLALEGTRRADEDAELEHEDEAAEPVFDGEEASAPEADATEAEVSPAAIVELSEQALEAREESDAPPPTEPATAVAWLDDDDDDEGEAVTWAAELPAQTTVPGSDPPHEPPAASPENAAPPPEAQVDAASSVRSAETTAETEGVSLPPAVVIDPDLAMLEWLKSTLSSRHDQVHIFQRTDLGVERIRQYLARAQTPLVLLAADAPVDPVSGGRNPFETVARLKRQSARMPILLLLPHGEPPGPPPRARAHPDAMVSKPSPGHLADERCVAEREQAARRLLEEVAACLRPGAAPSVRAAARSSGDAVARLREVSARIRDGASHGEVLPQVIAFAAQTFRRVALFMIREDQALGLAQVGLPRAGGPEGAALRELQLPCREPGWFRAVLETGHPVQGPPRDEGDRRLARLLGDRAPASAYVAPVESGGQVVALLYGDNLPQEEPVGETGALEVVLHEAGMALDRAVLERALEEAGG